MTTLKTLERNLLFSLFLVFFSLILVAQVRAFQEKNMMLDESVTLISVSIHGAVKRPGVYQVPLGSSSKSVVRKSRPMARADLRFLKQVPRIEGSVEWVIKEMQVADKKKVKR